MLLRDKKVHLITSSGGDLVEDATRAVCGFCPLAFIIALTFLAGAL